MTLGPSAVRMPKSPLYLVNEILFFLSQPASQFVHPASLPSGKLSHEAGLAAVASTGGRLVPRVIFPPLIAPFAFTILLTTMRELSRGFGVFRFAARKQRRHFVVIRPPPLGQ